MENNNFSNTAIGISGNPRTKSFQARIFLFYIIISLLTIAAPALSEAGDKPSEKLTGASEDKPAIQVTRPVDVEKNGPATKKNDSARPDFLKGTDDTAEIIALIESKISSDPKIVDRQIEKLLSRLMNSPDKLQTAFLNATPLSSSECSCGYSTISVNISGASFDNLRIDTASIIFVEPKIDLLKLFRDSRLKLISQKEIRARLSIREDDLNKYLTVKSEKIKVKRPFARFENDLLVMGGTFKYGIFVISFSTAGRFKIDDGTKIIFDIRSLSVNNMKMNRAFLRKTVEKINPLLDLEKFPFKLVMKSIGIFDGRLVFSTD